MIAFLLKASCMLAVFWGFYKLLLERESFFSANRAYLMAGLALIFILPFLSLPQMMDRQGWLFAWIEEAPTVMGEFEPAGEFEGFEEFEPLNPVQGFEPQEGMPGFGGPESRPDAAVFMGMEGMYSAPKSKSWLYWVGVLYAFGVVILSLNFLTQLGAIFFRILKSEDKIEDEDCTIINSTAVQEPCSFFRYIFINPAAYDYPTYEQILAHERIHLSQRHSLDLLLSELVVILLWFNPLAWMYRQAVEKNLEYQTDELLLREQPKAKSQYQLSLLKVAAPNKPLRLTSNYNQSLLKKRIIMMNAKKSNPHSYWKYAFLAPTLLMMLLAFNRPVDGYAQQDRLQEIDRHGWDLAGEVEIAPIDEPRGNLPPEGFPTPTPSPMPMPAPAFPEGVDKQNDCVQLIKAVLREDERAIQEWLEVLEPDCVDYFPGYEQVQAANGHEYYRHKPATPLGAAARIGHVRIGQWLVEEGAEVMRVPQNGHSPLMIAAANGHVDFMRFLLEEGALVNQAVFGEGNALMVAAREGQMKAVKFLVREGAHVNAPGHGEDTPIGVAARSGHTDIVAFLLKEGAHPMAESHGEGTPLSLAARSGHTATVAELLTNGRVLIDSDAHGEGAPISLAARSGQTETVAYLIRNGADLYAGAQGEGTPLSLAARSGHLETVAYLVKAGADIHSNTRGEGTPLSLAARSGHLEVVQYLLKQGADPLSMTEGEGTPLSLAARSGHVEVVAYLSRVRGIHQGTRGEGAPLSLAARSGHLEVVKYLLKNGADLFSNTRGEGTPLSLAARSGHLEVVAHLVSAGADLESGSRGEGTPLGLAARSGHLEVVRYLVKSGADLHAHTHGEGTPLSLALRSGHHDIAEFLIAKGADINGRTGREY